MLQPRKISVSSRRNTIFPSNIILKTLSTPIRHIKRRVRKYVICLQCFMKIIVKCICIMRAKVSLKATNSKIHFCHLHCSWITFLPID